MADFIKLSPDDGLTMIYAKDAAGRIMSEQLIRDTVGWTGKNKFDFINDNISPNTIVNTITNGIHVSSSSAGKWIGVGYVVPNPQKNTTYKLECDVDYVSGICAVTIKAASTKTDYSGTYIDGWQGITTDKQIRMSINTGNTDYLYIQFLVTNNTGGTGEANFTNIMLYDARISDSTYEPYHDNVSTEITDVYKVMGEMGAKNLLDNTATTTTTYGVTYTVNSDKSVTPSNTASGGNAQLKILNNTTGAKLKAMWGSNKDVIMTGCPSGGASNKYFLRLQKVLPSWAAIKDDYGDGISFNTSILEDESTYQVVISINDGYSVNSSFYPMIRLASDTDSTYQPYAMTNKDLTDNKVDWKSNGILGAKNIAEPVKAGQTINTNNVDYVCAADGTVTVTGLASADTGVYTHAFYTDPNEEYTITGCPSGGSNATYYMRIGIRANASDNWGTWFADENGNGATIPKNTSAPYGFVITCRVMNGTDGGGKIFKPMVKLKADTDANYRPYAKTNRELTNILTPEDIFANFFSSIPSGISVKGKGSTFISKVGKMVMGVVVLERADGFASGTSYTLTMDDAYKPRENFNATGQFLDNEWSDITESATGYMFLGNGGSFIIKQTSGQSLRYFKGMFAYTTL